MFGNEYPGWGGPAFAHPGGPEWGPGSWERERHHGHHHHHGHEQGRRFGPKWGPFGGPEYGSGPGFGPGPEFGKALWRMARRFGFGPGGFGPGGFGPGGFGPGGFGPGFGPRMFGRGNLKYVLLDLLQERPKHGYEMIKELEERTSGFYSPSAGAIYPTLQLLEDRGWVTIQETEGKKVYAITDTGRQALREHQQEAPAFGGPRGGWGWGEREHGHGHEHGHGPRHGGPFGRWQEASPELHALRRESMEVARLVRDAVFASNGDPQRIAQLRAIIERAHGELNEYFAQSRAAGTAGTSESGASSAAGQAGASTEESGPIENS